MEEEEEQQNGPKSFFPHPPLHFFQHHTDENETRLKELQAQDPNGAPPHLLDLPEELRYLVPPREPVDGKWKGFGMLNELNPIHPSLKEQGVEQLYTLPSDSLQKFQVIPAQLLRIVRSILANYLELIGIFAIDPKQSEQKLQALRTLFVNAEDLINQYRPHQARESVILFMEEMIREKRDVVRRVEEVKAKVQGVLGAEVERADNEKAGDTHVSVPNGVKKKDVVDERRKERQREAWRMMTALD